MGANIRSSQQRNGVQEDFHLQLLSNVCCEIWIRGGGGASTIVVKRMLRDLGQLSRRDHMEAKLVETHLTFFALLFVVRRCDALLATNRTGEQIVSNRFFCCPKTHLGFHLHASSQGCWVGPIFRSPGS